MKKIVCFTVLLFLLVVISGCENGYNDAHNADRNFVEERALSLVRAHTFYPYHTIERTVYNEEAGEFTVYVSPREESGDEIVVVIRLIENGTYWIDFDRMRESIR